VRGGGCRQWGGRDIAAGGWSQGGEKGGRGVGRVAGGRREEGDRSR